jgi:hypothetical protein
MQFTTLPPLVDVGPIRINRRGLSVEVPAYGEVFMPFPALDGAHVAFEIRRDVLPRVEAIVSRALLRGAVGHSHDALHAG